MCLSIGNFYLKSLNRPIRHHPFKYINNPPGLIHQKNSSAFSLLYPSYKPRATVKWQLFFYFFFFEVFQIVTYLIRICSGFYIVKLQLLTFADYTPHSVHNLGGIRIEEYATNVSLLTIKYNNNVNVNPATEVNLNSIK